MSDKNINKYPSGEVDVFWDGRLCIHVGECTRAKGELFVGGRDPWCDPDRASVEEAVDVVERCPTGALTYAVKDGATVESAASENTVSVTSDGPLFFRGDLDIDGSPDDMPGVKFRAALCRCGQSGNKPFCDNSHRDSDFQDYGAVGDAGAPLTERGGKLKVTPVPHGPLVIAGNLTVVGGSGRTAWQGTNVALCRCGASNNKPFCDGQHAKTGFKSD